MVYGEIITVLITSYHSEKTIIETLNSVYKQTYRNIELIISDDSSSDNTRETAQKWIETHQERFQRSKIYKTDENCGISGNFNHGMKLTKGEWIGVIAADDILLPNYVEDNVKQVIKQNCNSILFSEFIPFRVNGSGKKLYWKQDREEINYIKKVSRKNAFKQFQMILKREILCSPTLFINKTCFMQIGGCDLRIKNIDDWPLKMKLTKSGYKIYFFPKPTLFYRVGNSSSHSDEFILNTNHLEQIKLVKKLWCYPNVNKWNFLYYYQELVICLKDYFVIDILKNKNNKIGRMVNLMFNVLLPVKWKKLPYKIMELERK